MEVRFLDKYEAGRIYTVVAVPKVCEFTKSKSKPSRKPCITHPSRLNNSSMHFKGPEVRFHLREGLGRDQGR